MNRFIRGRTAEPDPENDPLLESGISRRLLQSTVDASKKWHFQRAIVRTTNSSRDPADIFRPVREWVINCRDFHRPFFRTRVFQLKISIGCEPRTPRTRNETEP